MGSLERTMDLENHELHPGRSSSFSRLSGASSSKRQSLSFSLSQLDDNIENESASEAGDIGDRALHSHRGSVSGRSNFSLDNLENGLVVPIEEDNASIASDIINIDEKEGRWLLVLEYITCFLSLAVFGVLGVNLSSFLGVLARYYIAKLFGPHGIGATSDQSYMYPDLFSNMAGSFLMGWLGVVYKGDIMKVSDQLAIGLTTGFLGSLTTFSGWNQKMLELSVEGRWGFAVLSILIGLFLAAYSIIFGIETAKGFKRLQERFCFVNTHACISNKSKCLFTFMMAFMLLLGLLWGIFIGLEMKDFKTGSSEAELYLACLVGPFGVWIRWFLARLNGRGLGKSGRLKWLPFGTLAANVLAACVMAALATLKIAVKTKTCETVASGIQLGLLGCLSTVSTFITEFNAMRESTHSWRAYAYASITFLPSFVLGTLIYSLYVWVS